MIVMDHIRSMIGVSRVALRLRHSGLSAVAGRFLEIDSHSQQTCVDAERYIQISMRSARLPWSTCLTRSIWICQRLEARGLEPQLVLGIHRPSLDQPGELKAHAWVVIGDQVLDENMTANASFQPLVSTKSNDRERTIT